MIQAIISHSKNVPTGLLMWDFLESLAKQGKIWRDSGSTNDQAFFYYQNFEIDIDCTDRRVSMRIKPLAPDSWSAEFSNDPQVENFLQKVTDTDFYSKTWNI